MEHDSWRLESSVFECAMVHALPGFGEAAFTTRAGESLHFSLLARQQMNFNGEGYMLSEPTVWSERHFRRNMGSVQLSPTPHTLRLAQDRSQSMISELVNGNQLKLALRGKIPVQVAIAPVGFRETLNNYQQCLASLLPVNFDQVKRSALYFESNGTEPFPVSQRRKLERVATYVLADKRITKIYVDGHTDSVGTRENNLHLAEQRATEVVDRLTGLGVPERLVVVRWHGERYPIVSNATTEGRSRNRRVTVRLERAPQ